MRHMIQSIVTRARVSLPFSLLTDITTYLLPISLHNFKLSLRSQIFAVKAINKLRHFLSSHPFIVALDLPSSTRLPINTSPLLLHSKNGILCPSEGV